MSLLDIHVELAETNLLLRRIADALDRYAPLVQPPDHSAHPLIGLADVSRLSTVAQSATLPYRASERVHFSDSTGSAGQQSESSSPTKSVTGAWDHDDALDPFEEFDSQWDNYAGVDR
jgi:hypothetical protein